MGFRNWIAAFLLLPAAFFGDVFAQTLYTLAGSGDVMVDTGDGTAATTTYIHLPKGVVADGLGNVYLTDESGFTRIRKVNIASGVITTVAGGGGTATFVDGEPAVGAFLGYPEKIALDAAGNLYIADTANHRVRRVVAATGLIYTVAGNGVQGFAGDGGAAAAASLDGPTGVAVDAAGNVFIADRGNGRIRRVDAATGIIATVAGNGVQGFAGDGGAATAASLNYPNGIALDGAGNLYVADTNNNRIRRVAASDGAITTVAGTGVGGFGGDGGPATAAPLALPWDVAVDALGNLLVADRNNMRVRRVSAATGHIATIAGNGDPYFNGENLQALATSLYAPHGVAVDATGAVYIADTNNYRVRSFVPPGATPQSIDFPAFAVRTYLAGETIPLAATSTSGLPVTFTGLTPAVCTVTGSTLTLVANGACTVAADQVGNAVYSAAPQVTRNLSVGPSGSGPVPFTFVDVTGAAPGRPVTSNTITVTGISAPLPIAVTGGTYSLGCSGVFTAVLGTVSNGQTVCVRHTTALTPGTTTDTLLTIGTTADTFTSTTATTSAAGVVTAYYQAILRRAPEPAGLAGWEAEAGRLYVQGADVNETWRAMALAFFGSAEYASFGRSDSAFVTDLYNAFFARAPDAAGLTYWTGQIAAGIPRQGVLLSFLFSPEFDGYMQSLFGYVPARPELAMVADFYRGFLGRLPDDAGLAYWVGRFDAARCTSPAAVTAEADAISRAFLDSPEYAARARINGDYVSDLYNGFMRRGPDLDGMKYWTGQLATLALTREQLRQVFLQAPEFKARVTTVASRGCT